MRRALAFVLASSLAILGLVDSSNAEAGRRPHLGRGSGGRDSGTQASRQALGFGYADTGLDADDRPVDHTSCCQQDPDIKSTTRRVWADEAGRRWLTITFVAYDQLIPYWSVYVPIDSRGGPGIDYKVLIFDPGTDQPGCLWWRYHSGKRHKGIYHAPIHGDRATCRVPLGGVHPEKRIRWRLYSPPGAEGHGTRIPEYAPDAGWYQRP
jgi:hypothetical protein